MKQRFILATMFLQGEGFLWTQQRSWLSDDNVCSWYGLSCTVNGRIQAVQLDENGVTGTIPTELVLLSELRVLSLGNNRIRGTIPEELFTKLSNIEEIDLSSNVIVGSIPVLGSSGSTKLEILNVENNRLEGSVVFSQQVAVFPAMRELNLAFNNFSKKIPTELGRMMPFLRNLDLRSNGFSGVLPTELGLLVSLESLRIEGNPSIEGRVSDQVCGLRQWSLTTFSSDCPAQDYGILCPVPVCCTTCIQIDGVTASVSENEFLSSSP